MGQRRRGRPVTRALVIAVVLLAAACGGGGDDDTEDATGDPAASSTTTTAGGGEPTGATTTTAAAGAEEAATTTTAAATTDTTAVAGGGAATSSSPAPVPVGTYQYRQSGSASGGGQTFDSPPEGKMVANEPDAAGTQVLQRYIDPEGEPSDATMRFGPDGIFMLSTVIRQAGREVTCTFDEPLPAPPWPPTVGATASGHADCDTLETDVSSRITGTTTVTMDGTTYTAFVVESIIDVTGDVQAHSEQIDHFVPELRLSVHTESKGSGKFGAIEFTSESTSDLVSAIPEPT